MKMKDLWVIPAALLPAMARAQNWNPVPSSSLPTNQQVGLTNAINDLGGAPSGWDVGGAESTGQLGGVTSWALHKIGVQFSLFDQAFGGGNGLSAFDYEIICVVVLKHEFTHVAGGSGPTGIPLVGAAAECYAACRDIGPAVASATKACEQCSQYPEYDHSMLCFEYWRQYDLAQDCTDSIAASCPGGQCNGTIPPAMPELCPECPPE